METRTSQPIEYELRSASTGDEDVELRLAYLLKLNDEYARDTERLTIHDDLAAAAAMRFPLDQRKAFALFGLMLGLIPSSSFFCVLLFAGRATSPPHVLLILLMIGTVSVATIVGYKFGKVIAEIARRFETRPFLPRTILFALLGALWGIVAGGSGGAFLFVIRAFFGAAIGGTVGAVALAAFSSPYLAMKRPAAIDLKHFLPISMGVTFIISAYILGFLYR